MCADGGGQRETGLPICAGAGWWPEHWPRPTPSSVWGRLLGSQGTEQLSPGSGSGDHVPTSRAGTADLLAAGPSWHLPATLLRESIQSGPRLGMDLLLVHQTDPPLLNPHPGSLTKARQPAGLSHPSGLGSRNYSKRGLPPIRFLRIKREEN